MSSGSNCDLTVNVVFPSGTFPSGTNVTNEFTADARPIGESPRSLGIAQVTHPVTTFVANADAILANGLAAGTANPPTLNQTSSGAAPLEEMVVTDLVPDGLTHDSWTFDDQATGLPAPQSFEQIPNFAGTGRTLLRWRWNAGSGSLGVSQGVFINISTTVKGMIFGAPGTGHANITNTFGMHHETPGLSQRCSGSSAADTQDQDGDSDTAEIVCTASGTIVTFNP